MNSSPQIEVGIYTRSQISLRLAGKFIEPKSGKNLYDHCTVQMKDNEIVITTMTGDASFGNEVFLSPCSMTADHFELSDVVIGVGFHWEQKETQRFKGALKLKRMGEEIIAINVIPIEYYLHSVISSEMNSNSSMELLKAHAIISRSWLMSQISEKKQKKEVKNIDKQNADEYIKWFDRDDHKDFHVCADDHCQRYQGISRVTNNNVIRAVNETKGEVLLSGSEICDARYSKSCGGYTELFENCWEPENHAYLQGFPDVAEPDETLNLSVEENAVKFILSSPEAFCNNSDKKILSQVLNNYDQKTEDFYRWEVKYKQKELSELIKKRSGIDFGQIKALLPVERGTSGRLIKLRIEGTKKSMTIGKELVIRKWLSESHLFSSAFLVESVGNKDGLPSEFILKGAGWGHGVGLCQIGAAVMGAKGYTYIEILNHYYRGAKIEKSYT